MYCNVLTPASEALSLLSTQNNASLCHINSVMYLQCLIIPMRERERERERESGGGKNTIRSFYPLILFLICSLSLSFPLFTIFTLYMCLL